MVRYRVSTLAVVGALGCNDAPRVPSPADVPSDSGGVSTRSYAAADWENAPRFSLDPTPVTTIDGNQKDVFLENVRYALILDDGRIVAMPIVNPRIYVFGADGKLQRVHGRRGNGPGDFIRPFTMLLAGEDSLYLPDDANARINWFHPDSGFIGAERMDSPTTSRCERALGFLPDGRVPSLQLCASELDSAPRPRHPLQISTRRREQMRKIAEVPGREMVMVETNRRGRRRTERRPLRLGANSAAVVWDSTIAVGTNAGMFAIDRLDPDGRVVARTTVAAPRRVVTEAMRDAMIALEIDRIDAPGGEGRVDAEEDRRLARVSPFADSLPWHWDLLVSSDQTLWAVSPVPPSDSSWTATAFARDGTLRGRLDARVKGTPMYFAKDRVLVLSTDADGVFSFAVYRFTPPR